MSDQANLREVPDPQTEKSAYGVHSSAPPPGPREVAERWVEAVSDGDQQALADLATDGVVDHDPRPGALLGLAGDAQWFADARRAFPDLAVRLDHVVVSGDEAAFAYTLTGTHTGLEWEGRRASGNGIDVRGLQMIRVADGKVVERYRCLDEATALRQLDGRS